MQLVRNTPISQTTNIQLVYYFFNLVSVKCVPEVCATDTVGGWEMEGSHISGQEYS